MAELWWFQRILLVCSLRNIWYNLKYANFKIFSSEMSCMCRSPACFELNWPMRRDSRFLLKPKKWRRVSIVDNFWSERGGCVIIFYGSVTLMSFYVERNYNLCTLCFLISCKHMKLRTAWQWDHKFCRNSLAMSKYLFKNFVLELINKLSVSLQSAYSPC